MKRAFTGAIAEIVGWNSPIRAHYFWMKRRHRLKSNPSCCVLAGAGIERWAHPHEEVNVQAGGRNNGLERCRSTRNFAAICLPPNVSRSHPPYVSGKNIPVLDASSSKVRKAMKNRSNDSAPQ